jgi:hypothetical protein
MQQVKANVTVTVEVVAKENVTLNVKVSAKAIVMLILKVDVCENVDADVRVDVKAKVHLKVNMHCTGPPTDPKLPCTAPKGCWCLSKALQSSKARRLPNRHDFGWYYVMRTDVTS